MPASAWLAPHWVSDTCWLVTRGDRGFLCPCCSACTEVYLQAQVFWREVQNVTVERNPQKQRIWKGRCACQVKLFIHSSWKNKGHNVLPSSQEPNPGTVQALSLFHFILSKLECEEQEEKFRVKFNSLWATLQEPALCWGTACYVSRVSPTIVFYSLQLPELGQATSLPYNAKYRSFLEEIPILDLTSNICKVGKHMGFLMFHTHLNHSFTYNALYVHYTKFIIEFSLGDFIYIKEKDPKTY